MDFRFDDDHREFQASLRKFLDKECAPACVRASWQTETGRSPELWAKLAEIGLLGMLVPEKHGGLGRNEIDLVLPLEETGRAAVPEPVLETAAVAAPLLVELGSEALCAQWLPRLAEGKAIVAVGHPANLFVADAHVADLLLLPHGNEVHAVDRAGARLERQPCNDPSRRIFRVEWTPGAATRVAKGDAAQRALAAALDRGALGCAAQQLGAAQRMLDMAGRYAGERRQFGQPIGAFQAVKHHLADVAVRLEFARPVVYRAAFSVARHARTRSADVSHAKVAASEAAVFAAKTALQIHGAIGYTWECDLQIWMKRAWTLDLAWGTGAWHRARVAAAVLDGHGAAATFGYDAAPA